MVIEKFFIEETEEPVDVYNFQVEDYHTYFVGECAVWVHNRTCTPQEIKDIKDHLEGNKPTDGAKSNGAINGCHEESRFLDELANSKGDLTNTIEPIDGIDGVNYVEYQTSSGDIKMKTIYDSDIISTDDYLNRGLEAYNKVPEKITDGLHTYTDDSGVNWNIFIRNDKLITIYPTN